MHEPVRGVSCEALQLYADLAAEIADMLFNLLHLAFKRKIRHFSGVKVWKYLLLLSVLLMVGWWWSRIPTSRHVLAVVNHSDPGLDGISNVNVTVVAEADRTFIQTSSNLVQSFITDSMGKAGPFKLQTGVAYVVAVIWAGHGIFHLSEDMVVPEGDIVDLVIVIDPQLNSVVSCQFLVISQVIQWGK